MPEITETHISPADQKLDRQLLLSLMLSPLAAGISTIVGFTVAHWITIVAYKRTGYLVSASCFTLCLVAAVLAWSGLRRLSNPDETLPLEGRQLFMAKLALLLSALCALVVLAGTLVLITLGPSD
jgi:formate/nitrite transporter FocA (FNT family)